MLILFSTPLKKCNPWNRVKCEKIKAAKISKVSIPNPYTGNIPTRYNNPGIGPVAHFYDVEDSYDVE